VIAFVLAATEHGSMLVPRLDYGPGWQGVGGQLLDTGSFDPAEVSLCCELLRLRRKYRGDGVMAVDAGANIGTHTLAMARVMQGWGRVLAIEAQERLFYALAGNICLNNLTNASARLNVLSDRVGWVDVPQPDYDQPGSYGSVELGEDRPGENIGQDISRTMPVPSIPLDEVPILRVDFIKLDVEGMELAVLQGANALLRTFHPVMLIEKIKSDDAALRAWLEERGYVLLPCFMSYLAVHEADPIREDIKETE
jgi:FkbM family methyltransferase